MRVREDVITEAEVTVMCFSDRGRGHEQRQPLEAGDGEVTDSPLEPPEGTQSRRHLDFSPKNHLGF